MWVLIFLYTLGLNTCQVTANENSTQMYYATLILDQSVFLHLQEKLLAFSMNKDSLVIKDLQMTTNCTNNSGIQNCDCMPGYNWDNNVCQSNPSCCGKTSCNFLMTSHLMCISSAAVDITGTITLSGSTYQTCLTDKTLQSFKECNDDLLNQMKHVYTTLPGFDRLTITSYSIGSIIVNFGMKIVSDVTSEQLINKSIELSDNLSGLINLETTGFLTLILPNEAVHYNASADIICKAREDLGYNPQWSLKAANQQFVITNGTVSKIKVETQKTTVSLSNVDELWEGEYVCVYMQQKDKATIKHKASNTMKICLQPIITTSTVPAFPHCRKKQDVLSVTIICQIDKTTENYTMTWSQYAKVEATSSDGRVQTYTATKIVTCNTSNDEPSFQTEVFCNFTNKCQQTKSQLINVTMIYAGEEFCGADGDWGDTKAGFTAVLSCKNQAGIRKRSCSSSATWSSEVSGCVNQDLSDVLRSAIISDIGLGELDANAANVFSRFQNITKTTNLDSFSNLNVSVNVLSTMQKRLQSMNNDSTINDFLQSSSNLLNESLGTSWNRTSDDSLLAYLYLSSVENLVEKSNITGSKNNTNLQVASCINNSPCSNTVFNATITMQSSSIVKTIGFKYLQNYLPSNSSEMPNSIVVSTTTEKTEISPEITINFGLIQPRPRNVKLSCVYWDNVSATWSSDGCEWGGPTMEGQCTCQHLSSFAILISNKPVEVPLIDEITYVGLGISVMSLFICLVIELVVWSDVVKTNTLYLRHTAHVNIALCLLVADACFLASSNPQGMTDVWCRASVVLKHFCYLAMFFWMLCLSFTLLHQAVFLFHKVSKKNYLRFSLVVGYGCPLVIVFVTFLTCSAGAEGVYYSSKTCWLIYNGLLKGSFYTFIIPAATIVIVNIFSMVVVIMKLLNAHHQHADITQEKEKAAAKTVLRSVILLTPIFGVTWIFGFAFEMFDLANGTFALVINYLFVLLNTLQGFFILLTSYLCDRMTREALVKHFKKKAPAASSMSESTTKLDTSFKK